MTGYQKATILLACVAALGIAACGDEATTPPEAVPGELLVSVDSPNGLEGAAVLETADEGVVEITGDGAQVFHWRQGGIIRIVVLLDAPGEIRFVLEVEDINRPPQMRLVEVADPDNRLRAGLLFYRVIAEPMVGGGS